MRTREIFISPGKLVRRVLSEIAEAGFDPIYGARPLKRAIQAKIENPLAKEILSGHFAAKDTIHVDARGGHIVFAKGEVAQAA